MTDTHDIPYLKFPGQLTAEELTVIKNHHREKIKELRERQKGTTHPRFSLYQTEIDYRILRLDLLANLPKT